MTVTEVTGLVPCYRANRMLTVVAYQSVKCLRLRSAQKTVTYAMLLYTYFGTLISRGVFCGRYRMSREIISPVYAPGSVSVKFVPLF